MKTSSLLMLAAVGLSSLRLCGADFYVSPSGGDDAAGTAEAPFRTLRRAQRAVRALRLRDPDRDGPVVVDVKPGRYELREPLLFTPADSGTERSPAVYRAAPGGRVELSGGRRIDGWRRRGDVWETTVPEVAAGQWRFSQLFVNGERRYRPRVPSAGYSYMVRGIRGDRTDGGRGWDQFEFRPGDIDADWHNLTHAEVLVFHNWSMSRIPIAEVDGDRYRVVLAGRSWHDDIAAFKNGKRFLVENVAEALDAPGEWYLDRTTGRLRYWPLPGEEPAAAEVIAPDLDHVIRFAGDVEAGLWVEHITLQGFWVMHANWNVPDNGYCTAQSEVSMRSTQVPSGVPAAVQLEGARHCVIEGCTVAHTGYYGIHTGLGCRGNVIRDCSLWDLGAGGIKLGTPNSFPEDDARLAAAQTVVDCTIARGGRMHPAACGVWIGHSPDNRVLHNDIFDFYYTAISVGWSWHYGYSPAKRNLIAANHIYDIGQNRLSDLGGIYTLGASEGTVLRDNRIHDISRVHYGGSGIYFDQGTTGIEVTQNVVYRTQDATFTVHWGRENVVHNNIFAFGDNFQIGIGRDDKSGPLRFERNIVVWRDSMATSKRTCRDDWEFEHNLYWCYDGEVTGFQGRLSFAEWQALGKDRTSVVADPGFRDPENGDVVLAGDPDPIRRIGFAPFPLEPVGRRTQPAPGTAPPAVPAGFPRADASSPPPMVVHEGFEEAYPEGRPPLALFYENNETHVMRVSEGRAATGVGSLRVVDGADAGPSYNPHMFYKPHYTSGTARGGFSIYFEQLCAFSHEWRDGTGDYTVGPALRISDQGVLTCREQELLTLPARTWIRIEILGSLGHEASGRFDLTVRVGNADPVQYRDLPCDPACTKLDWWGFVAAGTDAAVFYLDDLLLEPVE